MLQQEYRPVLDQALALCRERFGAALHAVYLSGSVGAGEAVPGVSDVDWFCFLNSEPTEPDRHWAGEAQRELQALYPVAAIDFHMNLFSIQRLRYESFWRFICRYNAVRVHGSDLLAELEQEGIAIPAPTPELARSRRAFVAQCLEQAVRGQTPAALAPLPGDPPLATRKLARNFVVVEGAYLLMLDGAFTSFREDAVLERLDACYPAWRDLLLLTRHVLSHPQDSGVEPDAYMKLCAPFVQFILGRLDGNAMSQ